MKELFDEVKTTIVEELNLSIKPSEIGDDVLLFEGGIGLDSVDGLELLVAIERKVYIVSLILLKKRELKNRN